MDSTIALVMIVRDEEAHLERCLNSVKDQVDEIVIVDTGSRDRTLELARHYTQKLYTYQWTGNFSTARNYAIERASSEWILSLDADEELDVAAGELRTLVQNNNGCEAFFLPLFSQADETGSCFSRSLVLRLFRNLPDYRFSGRIHEQIMIERPGVVGITDAPVIWHRPVAAKERNQKRARNLNLLLQAVEADPANSFLQYYLGLEWLGLQKPAQALECFQRTCRELDDSNVLFRAPAVLYRVHCLKVLGQLDEALCICLEESSRYPSYSDLFFEGGVLLELKGEYAVAIRWFKEALNCGTPPPLFTHTVGTEGFLALYHLGYCSEQLGQLEEACDYYKQALAANPDYIYPLYSLFLLERYRSAPPDVFQHFRKTGYLRTFQQAAALAELFFASGRPDIALLCLKECPSSWDCRCLPQIIRFSTYGGEPEHALSLVNEFEATCRIFDVSVAVHRIVALLLLNDSPTAREQALRLWRKPEQRSEAWALLNLVSLCSGHTWCGRPEKPRERAVIKLVLDILDDCLRSSAVPIAPGDRREKVDYARLAKAAMKLLADLSAEGCTALTDYLKSKAEALRQTLDKQHRLARRLYK
ncbi:glycosyltransferase [Desulforudis sp. 1088]|uniref:glycosyltransferase n=1 Tax=unclassified Candidatus Desulforudis TaxID=2635950 RepID=UPI003CE5A418